MSSSPDDTGPGTPVVRVTVDDVDPPDGASEALEGDEAGGAAGDGASLRRERGRDVLESARATADGVEVREVGSTGVRAVEPLVTVADGDRVAFHRNATGKTAANVVEHAESDGVSGAVDGAAWVVDRDPDGAVADGGAVGRAGGTMPQPDEGPLSVGDRRVLGRCGWTDPESGAAAADGAAALALDDPAAALDRLEAVGLLGRGRGDASADEPVADRVAAVREASADPVVVVNANESDARDDTDATLLGGAPDAVLDGALALAAVVGAEPSDVVVYTNESDELARRRTRRAVTAVAETLAGDADGVEGDGVAAADRPQVVAGPDEYVAGEHTMALEALEGNDRLEARIRPPGPERHGLYGRPTLVHTPRTLAQVRAALVDPDAFDRSDADPGTRLFTVSGDVASRATVELPTGGSLRELRDAVEPDGGVRMACVGGRFGGFTDTLDHGASALALENADLGTGGAVELFGDDRCPVATIGERARVASEENCGRCFPCREGSKQAVDLLRHVYDGHYEDDMLRELARTMRRSSICHFGRSAGRSLHTALDRFEPEFEAHAAGRCPAGSCEVGGS